MKHQIAFSNMRYRKNRNSLIGIAIFLTTLLLYLVPTIGYDMVQAQFATVNKIYPTWHAVYRNVDSETVEKLRIYHDVKRYGLRSDAGKIFSEDANISLFYLDENAADMYRIKLLEGELPKEDNEIVLTKDSLKILEQKAEIGDSITVTYQVATEDGLDYKREKKFIVTGFLEDTEANSEKKSYAALISKKFLEHELDEKNLTYNFLFQVISLQA